MSRVTKAIILSDQHLGRDVCYLNSTTAAFAKNSEVLLQLLKSAGPQDELILNGDLLELSLAGLDEVYRDLRAFFKILAQAGPYKRIVYIPGNH
ncbi:MAG: hypothetical protein WAN36_02195, partial [Calditrichia bacterium]